MKRCYKLVIFYLIITLILLTGCSTQKYQRIIISSASLGPMLNTYTDANTSVAYSAKETHPAQLPIYEIEKRNITTEELDKCEDAINSFQNEHPLIFSKKGNVLEAEVPGYDTMRKYYDWTDSQLEEYARAIFDKLPFLVGTYEYLGITSTQMLENYNKVTGITTEHIYRVRVSFRKVVDGLRVIGDDRCDFYIDGDGLVMMQLELYNYKQIGTMDVVPLDEAKQKIKTPDAFTVNDVTKESAADKLDVEKTKLLLVNQSSYGCTILQPVYNFMGSAYRDDDVIYTFSSRVIAIPDKYTK